MKAIAIANGKGGAGKTSLAVSIAISLAEHGHSTLLVDADLALASVDLILGLKPQTTLKHVVCDGADVAEALQDGPEGIQVLVGSSGCKELTDLDRTKLDEVVQKVLGAGRSKAFVVFDTASGVERNVLAFLAASDRVMLVATPDPTSVMDAYGTAKVLFAEKPNADVSLLVNMANDERHGLLVFERFKTIVGQFLNREVTLAGVVPFDLSVQKAMRARSPFILFSPKCKASKSIDAIVEWLTADKTEQEAESPGVSLLQRMRSVFAAFKKHEEATSEEPEEKKAA